MQNCPVEWLSRAILLRSEDDKQSSSSIVELPAMNRGGPYFEISPDNEKVTACDIEFRRAFVKPRPLLYIPVHAACIQIAFQVCRNPRRYTSESDSLRHIWNVLKARYYKSSERCRVPPTRLHEPNDFYGELWRFQDMQWEPGEDPALNYESQASLYRPEDDGL